MIEKVADLWKEAKDADAVVITTNGFVKKDGTAVMGRGCAKEAARWIPDLPKMLGERLQAWGNQVFVFWVSQFVPIHWTDKETKARYLITFPVKPASIAVHTPEEARERVLPHMMMRFGFDRPVPGWAAKADPRLIEESWGLLRTISNALGWKKVVLPRPGCGNGGLNWPDVRKIFFNADDRFVFVTDEEEE